VIKTRCPLSDDVVGCALRARAGRSTVAGFWGLVNDLAIRAKQINDVGGGPMSINAE
jgi:hypothetical protein